MNRITFALTALILAPGAYADTLITSEPEEKVTYRTMKRDVKEGARHTADAMERTTQSAIRKGGEAMSDLRDSVRSGRDSMKRAFKKTNKKASRFDPKFAKRYKQIALRHEAASRYKNAISATRMAIRSTRNDPEPFLIASRIRMRMNDPERSSGNLYYAVRRAKRSGRYAELSNKVRVDPEYRELLEIGKNRMILDLYDSVDSGILSEAEAKERIRGAEAVRDALIERKPTKDSMARVLSSNPMVKISKTASSTCMSAKECRRAQMPTLIEKADAAFQAGNHHEAASIYQMALALNDRAGQLSKDQQSAVLERIGVSMRNIGLLEESEEALKAALKNAGPESNANFEIAATYSLMGKERKAFKHLHKNLKEAAINGRLSAAVRDMTQHPDFNNLRKTKAYQGLMRQYGAMNSRGIRLRPEKAPKEAYAKMEDNSLLEENFITVY